MLSFKCVGSLLLIGLLMGCGVFQSRPDVHSGAWVEQRRSAFADLSGWRLHGRMAIADGERGGSASFVLNDDIEGYLRLNISATAGRWRLLVDQCGAELEGTRMDMRRASRPEPLVSEALGWYLPVSLMRDWVRGLPAPPGARLEFNDDGTLRRILHQHWTIEYQRYREHEGLLLPQRLEATNGAYRVRLMIRSWLLNSAKSSKNSVMGARSCLDDV